MANQSAKGVEERTKPNWYSLCESKIQFQGKGASSLFKSINTTPSPSLSSAQATPSLSPARKTVSRSDRIPWRKGKISYRPGLIQITTQHLKTREKNQASYVRTCEDYSSEAAPANYKGCSDNSEKNNLTTSSLTLSTTSASAMACYARGLDINSSLSA
jgi:hypothetical protein